MIDIMDFTVAYLEPGAGSLLIQVIIASILAVPYFFRTQIGKALGRIRGTRKPDADPRDDSDDAGAASAD